MPELPEIEHLRRTLEPVLCGSRVTSVRLDRVDVTHGTRGRPAPSQLLAGRTIEALCRHGKQLALISRDGPLLCVHLGMTGQLRYVEGAAVRSPRDHVHCRWRLVSGSRRGALVFRDPRRFGGLWVYPSLEDLRARRWARLGPDALSIRGADLRRRLARTRRPIKTSLLDQSVLAGVGNIYADEALHAAGVHPLRRASTLSPPEVTRVAARLRSILRRAIEAGGSTLRDYRDAHGGSGRYASRHRVYGRSGAPCHRCRAPLNGISVGQRTTVFCPRCQPAMGPERVV